MVPICHVAKLAPAPTSLTSSDLFNNLKIFLNNDLSTRIYQYFVQENQRKSLQRQILS